MDIDKELEEIFDDPLLKVSYDEAKLFDIPQDMRRVIAKKKPDYVAQHKLCENFEDYRPLFARVHRELKQGLRSLMKINKTATLLEGRFYFVSGQMLRLEKIGEKKKSSNSCRMPGHDVFMRMGLNRIFFFRPSAKALWVMAMLSQSCNPRVRTSISRTRMLPQVTR